MGPGIAVSHTWVRLDTDVYKWRESLSYDSTVSQNNPYDLIHLSAQSTPTHDPHKLSSWLHYLNVRSPLAKSYLLSHLRPSTASVGLLVPLHAKPTETSAVVDFLDAGYSIVTRKEPLTVQWFALKYASSADSSESTTYAVFDTFAAEEGRKAHLEGDVAAALGANAEKLFSEPPKIGHLEVLASKVTTASGALANGLIVLITAKPEKVEAVKNFLIVSIPFFCGVPLLLDTETYMWIGSSTPRRR